MVKCVMRHLQQGIKVLTYISVVTGSQQQGDTNMTKLRANTDYVIVELVGTKSNVTEAGIIMSNVEQPTLGRVISVGAGKYLPNGERQEHNIIDGDIVIFGKSSLNQPIQIDEDNVYY